MTVFERYDLPAGRTPESFRFHVAFLWDGVAVEDYYTDDPVERDRLVRTAAEQEYDVLVELGTSVSPDDTNRHRDRRG